jgi:SAM-dependent methyltransferase
VSATAGKKYDERYFRRWYGNRSSRIATPAERARRVAMVVAVAEYVIGRRLRTVLDVGCGEARWQPVLHRLRPALQYVGVDSSEYAVRRYGRTRGVVAGTFDTLGHVVKRARFDLVVAADLLHYLSAHDLQRGLPQLAALTGGVAYIDFFTSADEVEGDLRGMKLRAPRWYASLFGHSGLHPLGMQFWCSPATSARLTGMERAASKP